LPLRIQATPPGGAVHLGRLDPGSTAGFRGGKTAAQAVLDGYNARLETLQELLWAEGRRRVLVVLQGTDTSGKDGVIRHVFEGVNPAGVRVASFKAPSAEELAHDFLWRVHRQVPGNGEIVIFNRSHYEDVLVVRVRRLVDEAVWQKRYDQINDFERLLVESGTTVLKFFLHISPEEQAKRLRARIVDPTKRWKFKSRDLEERALWLDYEKAYEVVLERTSTRWAPWWVVPSDRKWVRNLVVSQVLVETLESFRMAYPAGEAGIEKLRIPAID
jgi:PPK2 family polyphosphate:nucleotide phosphotransferase